MPKVSAKDVGSVDDIKGQQRPAVGKYHMSINHWDETFQEKDAVIVEFGVLDGNVPGQFGRTIQEKFFISEKAVPRLVRMCLAAGLILPGQELDSDLTSVATSKQLIVEIVPHSYENKEGKKVDTVQCAYMGFWPVDHAEVADVPKNQHALAMIGRNIPNGQSRSQQPALPNGNGTSKQQQQPAAAQQQPVGAAAGGGDDWSDLT